MIIRLISVFVLSAALNSGCSFYRLDVQQGNYITQEQVSQITPGMSRDQVRELLGTPLLTDDFRQNRWDYVFYLKEGNKTSKQNGITVFFNDQGIVTNVKADQTS